MNIVLDANAVIAYLNDETGGDVVDAILLDESNLCYMHSINACEVYYDFVRRADSVTACAAIDSMIAAGVVIIEDMDAEIWKRAGEYKADLRRISLADCFCAALANRLEAEMLTADHSELDIVKERGLCKVRFIR